MVAYEGNFKKMSNYNKLIKLERRIGMDINIEKAIQECIDNLDKNEDLRKNFMNSYDAVIKKQQEIFMEIGEKVSPIITFLKERRYHFNSDFFNCYSSMGPVVANENGKIFTYKGKGFVVDSFDTFTKESIAVTLDNFLMNYSFKEAMQGLLSVLSVQTNVIKEYQKLIDQAETEINEIKGI